jgi:hypothetical protein
VSNVYLFGDAAGQFGSDQESILSTLAKEFQTVDVYNYQVLAAWSSEPDYEMSCWLLLLRDSKLYEVDASHCSCYGYEDTFLPTESSIAYLSTGSGWRMTRVKESNPELWHTMLSSLPNYV